MLVVELNRRLEGRVDPDLEAVRRAKAGDDHAFEKLISKHGRDVYAVCRRFTRDAHEAEDLAQETFIRVHKGLRAFHGEASFRTWLFRIVVNVGRTWWRMRSRRREPAPTTQKFDVPSHPGETLEAVRDEIARLPERQRLVLSLRVFGGLEYEEVADILGITPESARVRLSLARKTLAERLGPLLEE